MRMRSPRRHTQHRDPGRTVACAMVFLVTACSSSTPLVAVKPGLESALPAGTYQLTASPLVSPTTLKCSNSDRYLGACIQATVRIAYDGDVLVATSATPQDGDLEIRISISGSRFGGTLVSGTARGTAIDRHEVQTVGVATLGFSDGASGAASLSGELYTYSTPFLSGGATGSFLAESILGRETCQNAQWKLQALPSGG
jgi:hypothetical protein